MKLGVSGWQEESRGESKLSIVIETGLGKDDDVVWEGSMVSVVKEPRSEVAAEMSSPEYF